LDINTHKVIFSGSKSETQNLDKFKNIVVKYSVKFRSGSYVNLFLIAIQDIRKVVCLKKGDVLYVVDEYMAFLLSPIIFYLKFKNVTLILDLFDSVYLKNNRNFFTRIFCFLIYKLFKQIIVTDENRKDSLKGLVVSDKIKIVENFPFFKGASYMEKPSNIVNLFFYGLLQDTRGWSLVRQFENDFDFNVYIAGRNKIGFAPEELPKNFIFLDLMTQEEVLFFMEKTIHWVFCLYEPINDNNVNASPNKIYDAIHSNCGIIINSELKISDFVLAQNLGLVLKTYYDDISLYKKYLIDNSSSFVFSSDYKLQFSFDKYENYYKNL
jgi:hypothetical protein